MEMQWYIPPEREGWVIEEAYASSDDGYVWLRRLDPTSGFVGYWRAEASSGVWRPWEKVPEDYDWVVATDPPETPPEGYSLLTQWP
jgi:hypothetical protein